MPEPLLRGLHLDGVGSRADRISNRSCDGGTMTNSPDRSSAENCDVATLADKIAAWSPSSKGPLVFIARERRLIEDALRSFSVAQAERVWHRKDCPFCGSPDGQYSAGVGKQMAAFFCKGCGINEPAQPPAAPVETGQSLCEELKSSAIDDVEAAMRLPPLSAANVDALIEALTPFAEGADWYDATQNYLDDDAVVHKEKHGLGELRINVGHLRAAKRALRTFDLPQPVPLTQQDVADVIAWAKEHDLPVPLALFAHFKMSRGSSPLPRPLSNCDGSDK